MKSFLIIVSITLTFILIGSAAFAQAPPPSSNPPGAPLDVLATVLLVGGAAYGYKRIGRTKSV